jgi:hypothetical protein|tara:strand:+ start:58 stop:300 length:243 start_codon:yes stop_codon:yes gene_type:complete
MKANIKNDFSLLVAINESKKALNESSISIACLLDDVAVNKNTDINLVELFNLVELQKDIEHIQDQITYLENNFKTIEGII